MVTRKSTAAGSYRIAKLSGNWKVCTSTVAVGLASSPLVHRARAIHVSRISRSEWNRFDSPCAPQAGARIGEADSAA